MGVFWIRLTLESVEWINQITLPNVKRLVGLTQSVEGLNRTERLTLPDGFDPFLLLDSRWNNSYFWVLNVLEFGHHCFSWFLSLQTWTGIISLDLLVSRLWLQILGLVSLIVWDTHTHILVFPYNNSYFCKVIGMSLLPLLVLVMCNFCLIRLKVY